MAEDERDERPSLELPRLSLRRRRRPAAPPEPEPQTEQVESIVVEQTRPILVDQLGPDPEPERESGPEPQHSEPRERGPGGLLAVVLTGLVVGLGIVGLTWASLRSCEGIQGTSSCGGAGYPLLGLILAVMVLVGWQLLRLLRVADPATTSFLAVGLAMVIALLLLVDRLMDRSMIVVIPLICAATFAAAHWVTRTFVEAPRD